MTWWIYWKWLEMARNGCDRLWLQPCQPFELTLIYCRYQTIYWKCTWAVFQNTMLLVKQWTLPLNLLGQRLYTSLRILPTLLKDARHNTTPGGWLQFMGNLARQWRDEIQGVIKGHDSMHSCPISNHTKKYCCTFTWGSLVHSIAVSCPIIFLAVVQTKAGEPPQPSIGLYFPPVAFPAVEETLMVMLLLETEGKTAVF